MATEAKLEKLSSITKNKVDSMKRPDKTSNTHMSELKKMYLTESHTLKRKDTISSKVKMPSPAETHAFLNWMKVFTSLINANSKQIRVWLDNCQKYLDSELTKYDQDTKKMEKAEINFRENLPK